MEETVQIKPGLNIGRYELLSFLGEGAMAVVYKAIDPVIDRTLAIKILREERCIDSEHRARFLREAKSAGNLSHPNIVTIHDVGEFNHRPFIVMELLDGIPLDKFLESCKPFTIEEGAIIGMQLADALDYAHKNGVVHRDIKPSNIVFSGDPDNKLHVKITDFGIAHVVDSNLTQHTETGAVLGTPYNISPEQVLGKKVDGRTDLFCLGITMYHIFSGQRPFNGSTLHSLLFQIATENPRPITQIIPDIPIKVKDIIDRLLQKQPEKRFQTGAEVAKAFKNVLNKSSARDIKIYKKRLVPFARRATLLVLITLVFTMIGSAPFIYKKQHDYLVHHLKDLGISYATFIADQNAEQILRGDWLAIDLFVNQTGEQKQIRQLSIVDHSGIIRGDTNTELIGQAFKELEKSQLLSTVDKVKVYQKDKNEINNTLGLHPLLRRVLMLDKNYIFTRPITYGKRKVGTVILSLSQTAIERLAIISFISIIAICFLCIIIGTSLVYYVSSTISKPVKLIKSSIDQITAGNYSLRITMDRKDEMGEAFKAFNLMVDKLQQREIKKKSDNSSQ